jgi:hypothetical protein
MGIPNQEEYQDAQEQMGDEGVDDRFAQLRLVLLGIVDERKKPIKVRK